MFHYFIEIFAMTSAVLEDITRFHDLIPGFLLIGLAKADICSASILLRYLFKVTHLCAVENGSN